MIIFPIKLITIMQVMTAVQIRPGRNLIEFLRILPATAKLMQINRN